MKKTKKTTWKNMDHKRASLLLNKIISLFRAKPKMLSIKSKQILIK